MLGPLQLYAQQFGVMFMKKTNPQSLNKVIRRIFKMALDRLFYFRLGYIGLFDCPTGLGN